MAKKTKSVKKSTVKRAKKSLGSKVKEAKPNITKPPMRRGSGSEKATKPIAPHFDTATRDSEVNTNVETPSGNFSDSFQTDSPPK